MRKATTILLAGAAALVAAGSAAWAAGTSDVHTMTITLPGGGIERIEYTGNVKPDVRIVRGATIADPFASAFAAPMPVFFGPHPAFVDLNRIAARMQAIDARMQAQMNDMVRQADALSRLPLADQNAPMAVSLGNMPAGSESTTMVSVSNGGHMCTHMTEITKTSASSAPQVVEKSSGDCGLSAHTRTTAPKSTI